MKSLITKNAGWLVCLAILLVTLGVYVQVDSHQYLDWDDEVYVTQNLWVQKGLSWESAKWAFTAMEATNWHPLTWLSHMLDYELFGLDSGAHHLTNLLFHILNSLLLFILIRRMTGAVWASGLVAALFALHPLHVESVAWVAERKDVLCAFFGLLALYMYSLYVAQPRIWKYLLIVILFALGLMAKPMLVTLPFVMLLLDYWPLRRWHAGEGVADRIDLSAVGRSVVEKIPLFALTVASCVITYYAQQSGGAMASLGDLGHGDSGEMASLVDLGGRIGNALLSYVGYIWKTLLPLDLSFYYPYRKEIPLWQSLSAGFFIAAVSLYVWRARRAPFLAVGWFWYLGTLVPVIGLVQVGWQSMADRYTYIPSIGLFILLVFGADALLRQWRIPKPIIATACVIWLVALSIATWFQVGTWRDSVALYSQGVAAIEEDEFVHYKLAIALADQGDMQGAVDHFREAIRIQPYDMRSGFNLGLALRELGKLDEAEAQFVKLLELYPSFDLGKQQLENTRRMQKQRAMATGGSAASKNPGLRHLQMGMMLEQQNKTEQAVDQYQQALAIDAGNVRARGQLAMLFFRLGRLEEAVGQFKEIIKLAPKWAQAHYNLGLVLARLGRFEEAIDHYRKALEVKPDFAEVHNNLGVALFKLGELDQAIVHFQKALALKPGYAVAEKNLQKALKESGGPGSVTR